MPALGLELIITFKCDWNCSYCLVDTHNQIDRSFKEVLEDAINIAPNTEVTFAGGETGMLPRRQLVELIDILKQKGCELDLLTNGLFIKKHEPLLAHFNEVWYHCVEYLTDNNHIVYPDLDQTKFIYILVAIDDDIESGALERMINRYPHIKFLVLPDNRRSHRITLTLFRQFIDKYKDRIHDRTLSEWLIDLGRVWGERNGYNTYGRIDKIDTTRLTRNGNTSK
jgi:organic radical activating enzyme